MKDSDLNATVMTQPTSTPAQSLHRKRIIFIEVLLAIVIFVAAAIACFPFFEYGAPSGHSISYNLAWLSNFSNQLLHGDIYPRWLTNMNRGAGSPVFFFYAPLPFYISTIGVFLFHKSAIGIQLAAGEWLLISFSGLSFYLFSRQRVSVIPAMLGAVLYMLLPYHFEIDLWRRQDVGELANYIWMPLIIYFIDRISINHRSWRGLAISYACLILSHIPTALLFSPFIALYTLVLLRDNRSKLFLSRVVMGLSIGILLSGIYLFPALFTQKYISTDKLWNAYFHYENWFFPITGKTKTPFTDRLFTVLLDTSVVFMICWLNALRITTLRTSKILLPPLLFFVFAWFLMTPVSEDLWHIAPFLWKVQFPWRVAVVLDFATAMILIYSIQQLIAARDSLSCITVGAACLLLVYCSYTGRYVIGNLDPLEDSHYIAFRNEEVIQGHDAPEYTTAWASKAFGGDPSKITLHDKIHIDNPADHVHVIEWQARKLLLDVHATQSTEITLHQFYFPGWRARILNDDRALPVNPGKKFGFARIAIPAGDYQLLIELTPLWQEIVGEMITIIGLILIAAGGQKPLRRFLLTNTSPHAVINIR